MEEKTKWDEFFDTQKPLPYFQKLTSFLKEERAKKEIYPAGGLVLNSFKLCPYYDLKVVMIGNEPLCDGFDMGLAFSSLGSKVPPIQDNIRTEIVDTIYHEFVRLGKPFPGWGTANLSQWATQGVLLLNSILTVAQGTPGSHRGIGWETFTIEVLRWLSEFHPKRLVFILWGDNISRYSRFIDQERHLVLKAPKVNGSKCFSQANKFLLKEYNMQIGWHLLN